MKIVFDINQKPYLLCEYGAPSAKCSSYVEINQHGVFHWCTSPMNHGFCMTLKELLSVTEDETISAKIKDYIEKESLQQQSSVDGTNGASGQRKSDKQERIFFVPDKISRQRTPTVHLLETDVQSAVEKYITDLYQNYDLRGSQISIVVTLPPNIFESLEQEFGKYYVLHTLKESFDLEKCLYNFMGYDVYFKKSEQLIEIYSYEFKKAV